jgi:hypothetical protein
MTNLDRPQSTGAISLYAVVRPIEYRAQNSLIENARLSMIIADSPLFDFVADVRHRAETRKGPIGYRRLMVNWVNPIAK